MSSGHTTGFDSCFLLCDIRQIMTFLGFYELKMWIMLAYQVANCVDSSDLGAM